MFLGRGQKGPTNIDEWAEHYGFQAICPENPECVHRSFSEMARPSEWLRDANGDSRSKRLYWKDGSSDVVEFISPRISPVPNKKSENDFEYVERLLKEMPDKKVVT